MTREQRAAQIWPLLAFAASLRLTLTYKRVGELIGAPPVSPGGWLELLPRERPACAHGARSWGVGRHTGSGFIAAENVPAAQATVFRHDWVRTPVPKPEELARALAERPSNGIRGAAEKPAGAP